MNIPNSLTLLRILLVPVFIECMAYRVYGLALLVLVVAGLTDAIDGLLARRWNQQTRLGMLLDPLADKLLLTSAFLSLSMVHLVDRKSTRLNSSHIPLSRMPSSA